MVGRWRSGPRGTRQSFLFFAPIPVQIPSSDPLGSDVVGGHQERFADQWDLITDDVFVGNIVRHGYFLEFVEGDSPPLTRVPFAFDSSQEDSKKAQLSEAVQKMLEKSAIEPVANASSPDFYSHLFLVQKGTAD